MWLYLYGGVYMDLDFIVQKSLTELFADLKGKIFFVSSSNLGMFVTNSFMASVPKHPFWLEYLKHMKNPPPMWAISKHFHVMTTTGPLALTKTLKNTHHAYSLLPKEELIPCNVCDIDGCSAENAYLLPIKGQSWNGWDSLAMNAFFCNFNIIVMAVLTLILIYYIMRKN